MLWYCFPSNNKIAATPLLKTLGKQNSMQKNEDSLWEITTVLVLECLLLSIFIGYPIHLSSIFICYPLQRSYWIAN